MPSPFPPLARGLASLLLPIRCARCARRVETTTLLCPACDAEMDALWHRAAVLPPVDRLHAAFPLAGAARDLVHLMKYQGDSRATQTLAVWTARRLREADARTGAAAPVLLVPVPLHPVRRRQRGFNQAERLADRVGRILRLEVCPDLLRRVRWGTSQTTLDRAARRASVAGAFVLRRPPPAGRRLVLVDDVWTTGATAEACQRALAAGTSKPAEILAAARTIFGRAD